MEKLDTGTDAQNNVALAREIEIDLDELRTLLRGLPRGVDEASRLAIDIASLAARMEPTIWRALPLVKVVPLCLNAIWRRTIDLQAFTLGSRRLLPFLTISVAYLYPAVQRARAIPGYRLQSAVKPFTQREIAVEMANADYLALVACDGDTAAAKEFAHVHAYDLRRFTREPGVVGATMIVSTAAVRRRLEKGVRDLASALRIAMSDFGV